MNMRLTRILGFCLVVSTVAAASADVDFAPISEDQRASILSGAPEAPTPAPDLKLKMVDFIDCSMLDGVHAFVDDGHSQVQTTGMGAYRQTSPADNSFFAYRLNVKNIHAPHLLVVEYPDDAERTAAIFFHEEGMKGTYNSDFHIEGGYATGGSYPITDTFNSFQSIFWPATTAPAVVVLNEHHGSPAAASRIWLYEITAPLPAAAVDEPGGPKRQIGIFFEDTRMFRFNFGRGGGGIEHCMQYLKYTGQNLLSFDAVIYGYPKCKIPAFAGGNNDTEQALAAADRHGIDVIAVFDPTKNFKVDGLATADLTDDAVLAAWVKAMGQFVDAYGSHKSLKGISFGGPAGCNRMSSPKFGKLQNDIYAMLQRKRPDLIQHVFFGYRFLHRFIFNEDNFTADKIVAAWEQAPEEKTFGDVLAARVADYYKNIHLTPADYDGKPNLVVHRSFYQNDHRCFRFYPLRTPRYMIFRDFNEQPAVTAATDTDGPVAACLFGNYFEVTTPLFAGVNFWWDRTWIAPQINPAEPYFLEAYTNALAQKDYPLLMNASWVNPIIGSPHVLRPFARAFRSLPAKPFDTVASENFVVTRVLAEKDATYLYLLNNHHAPAEVAVTMTGAGGVMSLLDGKQAADGAELKLTLPPYALLPFRTGPGRTVTAVEVARKDAALEPLRKRIDQFQKNIAVLSDDGVELAPKYQQLFEKVSELFNQGRYQPAATTLGWTPPRELDLRIAVTRTKPLFVIQRAAGEIRIDGDTSEWTDAAAVAIDTPEQLLCDRWLFNYWRGKDDLSARVWASYDDENLYLAFTVLDDRLLAGDEIAFRFAKTNHRRWAEDLGYDKTVIVGAPGVGRASKAAKVVQIDGGYAGEIAIPLAQLDPDDTDAFGFHVTLTDMDLDPADFQRLTRGRHTWRREKRMEWPVNPNFKATREAQSAGEIVLK